MFEPPFKRGEGDEKLAENKVEFDKIYRWYMFCACKYMYKTYKYKNTDKYT